MAVQSKFRHAAFVALASSLLLAGCGKAPTPASDADAASDTAIAASTPQAQSSPTAKQTIAIPSFRVDVTLSEATQREFAKSGETLIVSATYFANPKPGVDQRELDEIGQVDLGNQQIELHGAGIATLDGSAMHKHKLRLIEGQPQVNINVYSGRHTSPDNLLDCGMFQGSLARAASQTVHIHCKLLTEDNAEQRH